MSGWCAHQQGNLTSASAMLLRLLLLLCFMALVIGDDDYYQRLDVARDASSRDIRKAFKKLALTMHPDKNLDDPDAHEKFLKINRAYEVLKDEELRKKYDKYGEKGLDDQQQGGRYESWNFYRYDFGIYDDDAEVLTLDRGEFDAAVSSGELFFVNFYSPRCSHCHELAPMWREFAKEMDGVIRVAAVNCGDNRMMCRSKGIGSYPSLYVYRAGMQPVKYSGDRSKDDLVRFVMKYVTSKVTELWAGNFVNAFEQARSTETGWLLSYCSDIGDCLSQHTRRKLAGMLDGMANVGWVDCSTQKHICSQMNIEESKTIFYPPGESPIKSGENDADHSLVLTSLDAKEIYISVMQALPALKKLTGADMKILQSPWLIFIVFGDKGEAGDYEFKKLNTLLKSKNIKVGTLDCNPFPYICDQLYINSRAVVVFKGKGLDEYEIHHGKTTLYELVSFAKESVNSLVHTLSPETFPEKDKEPWLIDFFAPWCPPCRALLPELRKASRLLTGQLKFGTIDCTIHSKICNLHGIHAYPTTLIFNQSNIHEYNGQHSAEQLMEYVQDLMSPSVVILTPETYASLVKQRKRDEVWMVDFYAPWCGPCQALLPEWKRMARMLSGMVQVGSVDCQKHHALCQSEMVHAYPEIRLFPMNPASSDKYFKYSGWHRDANSLKGWAFGYLPQTAEDLTPQKFNSEVLEGMEHWLVDFYTPWCGHCQIFAPEFEIAARLLKGKLRTGKVNCQNDPHVCQSAGVHGYPTVMFYQYQGRSKRSTGGEEINSRNGKDIAETLLRRVGDVPLHESTKKDEL
ncbi:dnaJ homolog subfamily C member 10 [Lethenteron reissneri]|uniref:dnaJ homolog subfamily C member 10 n=1 Tax=Lethenteron reissneri TaxID=7753 RepID=UPI002AB5FBDD|nr:dnaJ homolog subfamily C member 10 [Lethenteron reissneri]